MAAIEQPSDRPAGKTKVRIVNFTKLAIAIGALAAAVNGYVQVRKDQNNFLETVSDKLNAITMKVAYLEGRVDGLSARDARHAAERRVLAAADPVPPTAVSSHTVIASPEVKAEDAVAYQKMPNNFAALQTIVEQKLSSLGQRVQSSQTAAAPTK